MNRRLTAWIVIVALLTGIGFPVHATRHASPGSGDFCSSNAPHPPAAPAPAHDVQCDACCGCGAAPAAAASPVANAAVAIAPVRVALVEAAPAARISPTIVRARGPPSFA
jgi:hypothetical protein